MPEIEKNQDFNKKYGQIIIYYPFKFKEGKSSDKTAEQIQATQISKEKGIEIYYDDFIKLVDTENSEYKNTREVYSIALDKGNDTTRVLYQPELINDNINKTIVKEFIDIFKSTLKKDPSTSQSTTFSQAAEEKELPIISKANIILYRDTHIGFLELFAVKEFLEEENCVKAAIKISDYAGKLKKVFFKDDNKVEYKNRKIEDNTIQNNTTKFINFINNIDNLNINVDENEILFNCRDEKKRAYSFCQLFVSKEEYDNSNISEEDYNSIILSLGRAHSMDGRSFTKEVAERFKYEDENSCKFSITASGFGVLALYTDRENFVYYRQHTEEQFSFLYEMCLHQRFYLYTVIEDYRDPKNRNYYGKKAEFARIITRYNYALISEVEPQPLYTKLRSAMSIESIMSDAKNALDMLQAIEEEENNKKANGFKFLITCFGLVVTFISIISFVYDFQTGVFSSGNVIIVVCIILLVLLIAHLTTKQDK